MRRRLRSISTVAVMLCIAAGMAWAQEVTTGTIEGTAKDPQGVPLPGVMITISSAQGTKSATTDQDGKFRFSYLTAGAYSLKAMLEGFNTVERQNLTVSLAASVNLEIILSAGLSEKIEVVGAAPVVDLSTATTGATISSELMSSVPLGRTFSSAVALAPGVVASGIDAANPSIGGASGLENTYVVDGVNIGNAGYGSAGSYSITFGSLGTGVNFDYIQEVQVKTGGYEPEFGEALGGFVNLVTKTGGNEVKGSVYSYLQSSSLEASRVRTDRINAVADPVSFQSYDFGVDVGGPIVKNKAFWYAAFDPTFTTRTRQTAKAITDGQGFHHELDADRNTYNYAANVKWFLNPKHTFSFSAFGDPAQGTSGAQRAEAVANQDASLKFSSIDFGGHNAIGRWTGEITKNLFAEGSVSYHRDRFSETPEHNLNSGVIDSSTAGVAPIQAGGVGFFEDATSQRYTYQLKLNSFIHVKGEEHSLRYGVEYQDLLYDHAANYSGPPGLTFQDEDGNNIVASTGYIWQVTPGLFTVSRIRSGSLESKTHADYLAAFFSDTWSPTRWLQVMAGLRWEQETLFGNLSSFRWRDNWAPRVHITSDPTHDGKTKWSFAYGRFFGKVPNDLAVRALSSEVTYSIDYPLSSVDLSDPNHPRIIGPQSSSISFGDQPTVIDPNSKLTFQDEYVASLEREVMPSFNVGVTYLHRQLGRTLEDVALSPYSAAVDSFDFGNYYITNPSPALGFPNPSRKYNAVTLKASKRFSDRWQVLSSYTWSRLRGNYEGYYRRDNGQSDPFITSLFDFPYLKDPNIFKYTSEDGLLPNDRTHVFNAYGSYRLPYEVNFGMSLTIQSGTPITRLGYNKAYETPGEIALEPRGASGRTPTTGDIGLHLDYPLRVGSGNKVLVVLDIFNLLNHQKAVEVDQNAELNGIVNPDPSLHGPGGESIACPTCANEDFGHATVYQSPFAVRFAARLVH